MMMVRKVLVLRETYSTVFMKMTDDDDRKEREREKRKEVTRPPQEHIKYQK